VPLCEADTRAKLIDSALHSRGWTEDLIRREETAGTIEIIDGKARRRGKGRTDYTFRVKVNSETQPVAVAVLEAKAEHLTPAAGLEQAKWYGRTCERLPRSVRHRHELSPFCGVRSYDRPHQGPTSPFRTPDTR